VNPRQGPGSLAYVPSSARNLAPDARLPIVVFLHGLNPEERLHPEFDAAALDPRRVVDEMVSSGKTAPFILAAPTHSRPAAAKRGMWDEFDLDAFLLETQRAIGDSAKIDRSRVVLAGHSGAGCSPTAGLLGDHQKVMALLAIDTCLDTFTIPRLAVLSENLPVRFFYQTQWPRPFDDLSELCRNRGNCNMHKVIGLGTDPHHEIIGIAFRYALPKLLPVEPVVDAR
jgi:hypothetical protein